MALNLCVPFDSPSLRQVMLYLMRLGWAGGCLTVTGDRKSMGSLSASGVGEVDLVRAVSQAGGEEFSGETLARARTSRGEPAFRQLRRVTVRVREAQDLHAVSKASGLGGFDVLAVQPESDEMLTKCCEGVVCDLITLDFSFRGNWGALMIKNVNKVKVRGQFFEVCCSAAFRSKDTDRVSFFSNVRKLVAALRGKNIVLSLDAKEWHETRGPNDLINLGIMCGMTEQDARDAVCKNPQLCLERGMLRSKTWRSAVAIEPSATGIESAFDGVEEEGEDGEKNKSKKKSKKNKKKKKDKKEKKKKDEEQEDEHSKHRSIKKQRQEPLI